ncbi:vacuolar protein sorting/targeting protein PEP1 [Borealophlyctis nickersoniae]|nr:vacuolar protein sorting/targeting protein PEP1 [Borealophlyctis nickersoniae]
MPPSRGIWRGLLLVVTLLFLGGLPCPGSATPIEKRDDPKVDVHYTKLENSSGIVPPPEGREPTVSRHVFDVDVSQIVYYHKSTVVLAKTETGDVYRSDDEGGRWHQILKGKGPFLKLVLHETSEKRVFLVTEDDIFYNDDLLETENMESLNTPIKYNGLGLPILDFHPTQPDWYVFLGGARDCSTSTSPCHTTAYATKDSGAHWDQIDTWSSKCVWGRDAHFTDPAVEEDSVYCMSFKYKNGGAGMDVLMSPGYKGDNTVQMVEFEGVKKGSNVKVVVNSGVLSFYVVQNVMVVAVEEGSDLKLLVSTDGEIFVEAKFPPNIQVEKNAFTVLESTTGGIFLDVSQSNNMFQEYGTLFKSNDNGTYYSRIKDFTNRNHRGQVDFEKLQGIEGIILSNSVSNAHRIGVGENKEVQSAMSFDDGATWQPITPPKVGADGKEIKCDDCHLHIHCHAESHHSHTSPIMHSSKNAAGLMLGVGNVGNKLEVYTDGNVYITRDAGRTWNEVFKDAHKWALGDRGGVMLMVNDERPVETLYYSWDFGRSWAEHKFTDRPIRISNIHTHPTSTSLKFIIEGYYARTSSSSHSTLDDLLGLVDGAEGTVTVQLDFSELLKRKCGKDDFEKWSPGAEGGARCFLGHKPTFWRRKPDAVCFVGEEFKDVDVEFETCPCDDEDFECDYGFFRNDDGKCVLYGRDPNQKPGCKKGEKYQGSSGYRKLPLSKCKGGKDLTKPIERVCDDQPAEGGGGGGGGAIQTHTHVFDKKMDEYFYFNNSATIIIRDKSDWVHMSPDNGKTWENILKDAGTIPAMFKDPFRGDRAYFITTKNQVWYTSDAGKNFAKMDVPLPASNQVATSHILRTHGKDPNLLIWTGDAGSCLGAYGDCRAEAYYSTDHGRSWHKLLTYVDMCIFADNGKFVPAGERGVLCLEFDLKEGDQRAGQRSSERQLVWSDDVKKGTDGFTVKLKRIVHSGVALFEEFAVAAMVSDGLAICVWLGLVLTLELRRQKHPDTRELKLHVSMNGDTWAEAQFPENFKVPEHGYTILESSTGSVFLDVFMENRRGKEHGTLLTSNGNGTIYSLKLEATNQGPKGYVDFEKAQGIEGIAMVNQVSNLRDVMAGSAKQLVTKISFNDGETWKYLKPPSRDSNNKAYPCRTTCDLHLHSYTERRDKADQFSSSGAIGLMMGVGNVGPYLKDYTEGDMFLTRDAGRTWVEVTKEAHLFEFGDQGAIILLVNDEEPIDSIKYTIDQGLTFHDYKITSGTGGAKIRVSHLMSEPSGTTSHFVIFGTIMGGEHRGKTVAVHLDFEGVWDGKCVMDEKDTEKSDYEAWSPAGEDATDTCWFGKQITYYRRKRDRKCRIDAAYQPPKTVTQACKCTVDDYECDDNYVPDGRGNCTLAPGLSQPSPRCDFTEGRLRQVTGYRKLKKSDCKGGVALDLGRMEGFCSKPISAGSVFLIVLCSFGIAGGVSWAVWQYREKLGFGRIRLPVDTDEASSPTLHTALVVATEAGERALSWIREKIDWIKGRMRRGQGYAPVGGEEGGVVWEDDDAGLNDLDDY